MTRSKHWYLRNRTTNLCKICFIFFSSFHAFRSTKHIGMCCAHFENVTSRMSDGPYSLASTSLTIQITTCLSTYVMINWLHFKNYTMYAWHFYKDLCSHWRTGELRTRLTSTQNQVDHDFQYHGLQFLGTGTLTDDCLCSTWALRTRLTVISSIMVCSFWELGHWQMTVCVLCEHSEPGWP